MGNDGNPSCLHILLPCLKKLRAHAEVNRERTFFMAVKQGFVPRPGFQLLTAEKADAEAHELWNVTAKPKLYDWLSLNQQPDEKSRLHALGNVVYPRQARLALHWLLTQLQSM